MKLNVGDLLLGLCKGIIADNVVNQSKAEFILNWLQNNEIAADTWTGDIILKRILHFLNDGIIDDSESKEFLQLLQDITGEEYQTLTVGNMSTTCFDDPRPKVTFQYKRFCLTGKFAMGPCKACEHETIDLGCTIGQLAQSTDYLDIGCIRSRDWIHTSYGRKIEKAKDWQDQGCQIAIISEDHLAAHL